MGARLIDAAQSWLSRVWQLIINLSTTAVHSGSVLGGLGVAQVGFSLLGPQPQRGVLVRRTWYNVLCIKFLCRGEFMGPFVCKSRNALGICVCGVCVIENFRQTARFKLVDVWVFVLAEGLRESWGCHTATEIFRSIESLYVFDFA